MQRITKQEKAFHELLKPFSLVERKASLCIQWYFLNEMLWWSLRHLAHLTTNVEIKGSMQFVRQSYCLNKDWLQVLLLRFSTLRHVYTYYYFAGVSVRNWPPFGYCTGCFPWPSQPALPGTGWGPLQRCWLAIKVLQTSIMLSPYTSPAAAHSRTVMSRAKKNWCCGLLRLLCCFKFGVVFFWTHSPVEVGLSNWK